MTTKAPSSSRPEPATDPASTGRLLVIEGLPGAGKTTLSRFLPPHQVIGEYTTPTGTTLNQRFHPAPNDDDAHQDNWLTKTRLADAARRSHTWVVSDRDWLSALAYAYTTAEEDGGALLARRTAWAMDHLNAGRLRTAHTYLILDVDPATSLTRRTGRLDAAHPWSKPRPLTRLVDFYRNPPVALHPVNADLTAVLEHASWHRLDATLPAPVLAAALTTLLREHS